METFTTVQTQACNLVIFGAKGDLVRRKLLPSLFYLEKMGVINSLTRIIAVGRANWNAQMYIDNVVRLSLETFISESIDDRLWQVFSARFDFCNLDVNETRSFNILVNKLFFRICINIYYFAMPPNTFSAICRGLSLFDLNKWPSRIVMEKPIGTDLVSAQIINDQVAQYFHEHQIYRIDHYLGKEIILNLLALRFANSLFISNWDCRTVDHVQITVAEEIGIEDRWGYFDNIGQTRDMVQSHLLQILAIVAMSPPSNLTADCIRYEKIQVLRSLRKINRSSVHLFVVRGQYTSGYINGNSVPGYLEEKGANKSSNTETFISIKVDIDNTRWFGVPFYLRTGKRLAIKYSEIVIYFKNSSVSLFSDSYKNLSKSKLIIRLYPNEGIDIDIFSKLPGLGHNYDLGLTKLNCIFSSSQLYKNNYIIDAYGRLLLEIMNGMQFLFVCRDEIENSWKWIDSIIQSWEKNVNIPLILYRAGTWGPNDSINMLKRDNRCWNVF